MSSATLAARGVSRFYAGRHAVAEASLDLRAGRIACLLGPSGCGKSTLLRLIAGLEPVDAGEISIGGVLMSAPGVVTPPEARGVGLVFQDFALFPHLSVADNIGFGLKTLPAEQRRERVAALLARFHLEALAGAWPHTLSGGEQQRVAIARALVRAPSVLLLDEPFSGLDGQLRAAVRTSALTDLRAAGAAVLIVTHDPQEALLMADDLVLMSAGRILQTGRPQDCYLRPVSLAAARLLGEAEDLPARIENGVAHTAFGAVPAPGMADGAGRVMVRPEALGFDPSGAPVEIVDIAFGGSFHSVTLSSQGVIMTARTVAPPPPVGTRTGVSLDPMRTAVYQGE
ncbi:MAG: ABC transporter ATP-binding protein [Alphaproteobacteria bacterium]|nr:ABC transporter ATP-binding protein [Alphaproteobacteria bacterium]